MISPTASPIFRFLRDNGVEVRHPTPTDLRRNPLEVDHRKIIVIDGARAMTGGMNVADEYRDGWHDAMVSLRGPAVHDLQRVFLDTWHHFGGTPVAADDTVFAPLPAQAPGGSTIRILTTEPGGRDDVRQALMLAIGTARHEINLEMAYFSDRETVEALIDAAKRGVTVNLILPKGSNWSIMDAAAQHHFRAMIDAGIKIHVYPGMLHTKAFSVDGQWATIGTTNAHARGFYMNREVNPFFSDPQTVATINERLFAADMAKATLLTAPPRQTLGQRFGSWVMAKLSPLL